MGIHVLASIDNNMDDTVNVVDIDDETLIKQAKTDKEAFGQLYQRYVERIYNYIYYRTSSVEDAEDLTARTFQRAMIHMPTYQDKGVPFQAWLYRIARNLVSNWYRDNGRKQTVALDDVIHMQVGDDDSPEQLIQMIERENSLIDIIKLMPPERQDVLVYKFLHRLSNAEIGEIMGKSEGAIKSLYHRTLLSLREMLLNPSDSSFPETKESYLKRLRFWKRDGVTKKGNDE